MIGLGVSPTFRILRILLFHVVSANYGNIGTSPFSNWILYLWWWRGDSPHAVNCYLSDAPFLDTSISNVHWWYPHWEWIHPQFWLVKLEPPIFLVKSTFFLDKSSIFAETTKVDKWLIVKCSLLAGENSHVPSSISSTDARRRFPSAVWPCGERGRVTCSTLAPPAGHDRLGAGCLNRVWPTSIGTKMDSNQQMVAYFIHDGT